MRAVAHCYRGAFRSLSHRADTHSDTTHGHERSVRRGGEFTYTKFLFVLPYQDDAATLTKIRNCGLACQPRIFQRLRRRRLARAQPQETIQFLAVETPARPSGHRRRALRRALSANYRPRLEEVACELKRRIAGSADIIILDGAERLPRYSSAEMHKFAYKPALPRESGRIATNAVIVPMSKTAAWWKKSALERHSYFYPHHEDATVAREGTCESRGSGHLQSIPPPVSQPRRLPAPERVRLHHYFECTDENMPVFDQICRGAPR